jgi:hypothetical protein
MITLAILRFEYIFDGPKSFLSWKVWVTLSLEDNDLWDIVKEVPTPPIDPKNLTSNKKREVKSKGTILNATNNHLIPHA